MDNEANKRIGHMLGRLIVGLWFGPIIYEMIQKMLDGI